MRPIDLAVVNRLALVDAARYYADHGMRVLPCLQGGKVPLISGWPERATADVATLRAWWASLPDANIGLLTGPDGFDVLDVDVRDRGSGWAALASLQAAGLTSSASGLVATPSGGRHLYFQGSTQRSSAIRALLLDFKAAGGFVVAPPSVIEVDGARLGYRWLDFRQDGGALDWAAVVRALSRPGPGLGPTRRHPTLSLVRSRRSLVDVVERAQPGTRNGTLFWAACRAVEAGEDPTTLIGAARRAGLSAEEAIATIASARRTERRRGGS